MTYSFVYVETDGDREATLREFISDGYVHARGRSVSSEHAYVLFTRHGEATFEAVERNPWARVALAMGNDWLAASKWLTEASGWTEDATYRGPPPTPWEREALHLLAESSVKVVRARWQGYWVMLMISHTEADGKGDVGIIPLAMIVDPALIEQHLRLVSPDGTDAAWEAYRGEAVIFPPDPDGEQEGEL